jgi:uncharacterized protein YjbI with pentapeptide repeats
MMLWKVIMDTLINNKATKQQVSLWKATLRSLNLAKKHNTDIKLMNTKITKLVLNLPQSQQC